MCMEQQYMFLTLIIPCPKNLENKIDVYLQSLVDELKLLWDVGVPTYDVSNKQNFQMCAALMWCVSDFPAYDMLFGSIIMPYMYIAPKCILSSTWLKNFMV